MSMINLNLQLLAYEDGPKTTQPKLRLADLQWSLLGLPTKNFKNIPIALAPGESMTVATTARTLNYNSSTSFVVTKNGDRMRIQAAMGQRAARNYGDGTTQFQLARTGNVVRVTAPAGTAPDFSTIRPGDLAYFGLSYSPFNQGEFQIIKVGSNYFEFVNDIAADEGPITADLNVYTTGPVQRGDILDLSSLDFAPLNQGQFPIILATDTFIEVLNQDAFPETVTGVTGGLMVYPFAYKWMMLAVDRKVIIGLNGESPDGNNIVEPPVEGDITNAPGILLKRGKVFELQIFNPSLNQVQGFVILAE